MPETLRTWGWFKVIGLNNQFNIIYIMRTNMESGRIRSFVVMIVLVADSL